MNILRNTGPTTLTETWYVNGTATDVGTVTIGIVDTDGNEVVAPGTATASAVAGVYTFELPVQTEVKELVITWTDDDDQYQVEMLSVIGGWLFTEAGLRAYYGADLASATAFTDAAIMVARDRITEEFEEICGVSFVPKYRRQTLLGNGTSMIQADRYRIQEVLASTINGTTQTASDLTAHPTLPYINHKTSQFTAPTAANPYNVTVSYRHGWDSPPGDIVRAAMALARHQLIKDSTGAGVPETASSWSDGTGQYVSYAANDQTMRWYGLPPVDNALRRYNLRSPLG